MGRLYVIERAADGKPYVDVQDDGNYESLSVSETFETFEAADANAREQGGTDETIVDRFHEPA
jgi:hypothetical protein